MHPCYIRVAVETLFGHRYSDIGIDAHGQGHIEPDFGGGPVVENVYTVGFQMVPVEVCVDACTPV